MTLTTNHSDGKTDTKRHDNHGVTPTVPLTVAAGNRGRGGTWVVVQTVLMVAVLVVGWRWPGHWQGAWSPWVVALLTLVGACVGIAGASALGRNRTIFPEPASRAELVETGIYRHIRHPLYLSVLLLSTAWACWRNSPWSLAIVGILGGFLVLKARHEEARLCRRFPHYRAYQRRTARFLPGLW